jgi:hypothetical protein
MSRSLIALAVCASLFASNAAQAIPVASAYAYGIAKTADLHTVDYRGHRGGHRRGYGGRGVGLGIAAAIIGGVVISQAARSEGYSRYRQSGYNANQRCADRYGSFDPRSGTYLGYDGERHVCPYLR